MRWAFCLLVVPGLAWGETPQLHLTVLRPPPVEPVEVTNAKESPALHLTVLRPPTPASPKTLRPYTFTYAIGLGYRTDELDWRSRLGPAARTRERWRDLDSLRLAGDMHLTTPIRLTFQGGLAYTWVLAGRMERSDEVSSVQDSFRIAGDAGDGHVFEVDGGLGYRFAPLTWSIRPYLEPLVGYAYRKQNLHTTEDFPDFDGHYRYRAEWYGPWLGLRLGMEGQKWGVFGQGEYHFATYRAEGDWKGQDREIRQRADGFGVVARAGGSYRILEQLALRLSFDFERWQTDPGQDRTVFADGVSVKTRLQETSWRSLGGNLALEYQF